MNNTESINEKIIQNMIEITDFDAPELDVICKTYRSTALEQGSSGGWTVYCRKSESY